MTQNNHDNEMDRKLDLFLKEHAPQPAVLKQPEWAQIAAKAQASPTISFRHRVLPIMLAIAAMIAIILFYVTPKRAEWPAQSRLLITIEDVANDIDRDEAAENTDLEVGDDWLQ